MYGIGNVAQWAVGTNLDFGDWLCKVLGICA
ncbi:hypothetical protein J2Y69_002024 [Microbacterium resistens]|uniref:Uncharacterized protein n=1 Tax=Microbacterium resistens TaxID=156977 RepID=A0ABU1SCT5_9MICO|nr:hypothetical protein [Microbacterium resistens]